MKKLVSRTEFAKMAAVSPSTVTRAALTDLAEAVDGKLIDSGHPAAVEYIKTGQDNKTKNTETIAGIDPLYERALVVCAETGRWSANFLKKEFSIGSTRAAKLAKLLESTGVATRAEIVIPEAILAAPRKPHIRGTAAAAQKKIEADAEPLQEVEIPENIAPYADMTLREVIERFGTAPRFKDWLSAVKDITVIHERQLKNAQTKGQLVSRDAVHSLIIDPINSMNIKMLRDGSQTIAVRVKALCEAGAEITEIKHFVEDTLSSFIKPTKTRVARALENLEADRSGDDEDV